MCWWVCSVLMSFVWRSLGVGMGVLGWEGCVFGGVGGWVSELFLHKWHSV